jgi:hypothetical protein
VYKHLTARPAAYTVDEVIKPDQAMDLMRLSLINQAINMPSSVRILTVEKAVASEPPRAVVSGG